PCGGVPGVGTCVNESQQCTQLSNVVCSSDADCVNDPNFPGGKCVTTHCEGTTPDVCPAPRCFPAECTTSTTSTTTTTTSTTTTSTSSTTTTSTTSPPVCGNGAVEPGEQCDPPGPNSPQCPSSPMGAFVACQPNCQCCNPTGAEGASNPGSCSDMIDNDCNGKIDCNDPGCGPTMCVGGS